MGPQLCRLLFLLTCAGFVTVRGDPVFPNIWEVVYHSYYSEILVTVPEAEYEGVSMAVDEFYQRKDGAGMVEVIDHGEVGRYNYYVQSEQTFYVKNYQCQVQALYDHPGYHFWGWMFDTPDGSNDNFIFGPSALLRASRDFRPVYHSDDIVRGIEAELFTTSIPASNGNDVHNVTYSFAKEGWNMPYGDHIDGYEYKAPLRITVSGPDIDPWNPSGGSKMLRVDYEYINFTPYLPPVYEKRLLVQHGVDCPNRISLDPDKINVPVLNNNFKVHMEFVFRENEFETVSRAWMFYDQYRRLVRLDDYIQEELNYLTHLRNVHDYSTGIAYIINANTGECNIRPITDSSFGSMGGALGGVVMADPDHIFFLDDKYMFSGYDEQRGLQTERWTSTRDDIPSNNGGTYKKAVVDFQFLRNTTIDVGERPYVVIPVRMDITVYKNEDTSQYWFREAINFLHFETNEGVYLIDEFDVRECYDLPQQRDWLRITFQGVWDEALDNHIMDFEKDLTTRIFMDTDTSFIRMPEMQFDHDEDFVYVIMLLLESAPYSLEFAKNPDKKPTDHDLKLTQAIDDVDVCAHYCLTYIGFECKSFYECVGQGQNCYLSNYVNSTGTIVLDQECEYYVAIMENTLPTQPTNQMVELWLEEVIVQGTLVFSYQYTDSSGVTQESQYRAIRYKKEVLVEDPLFVDYLREDFSPLILGARLKSSYVLTELQDVSYAECLVNCEGWQPYRCETFSYCYDSAKCFLSETIFVRPMLDSEVVYDGDCNTISRQFISDYTITNGAILAVDVTAEYTGIEDPNYCAYLCDMTQDLVCRSFDYCYADLTCFLHDTHSLDAGDGALQTNNTFCSHFSRSYLIDFVPHENTQVSGSRDVFIEGISAENCAKECIELPDYNCNGFDMCIEEDHTTCFLTQNHYSGEGTQITTTLTCDHYERAYYDGKDINTIVNQKDVNENRYSPGDMAGLAIGVLACTIGLCLAGFYYYTNRT